MEGEEVLKDEGRAERQDARSENREARAKNEDPRLGWLIGTRD